MKFRNLILILFELIKFNHMKKIAKCTVQMGCVYSSSVHPDRRGTTHLSLSAQDETGEGARVMAHDGGAGRNPVNRWQGEAGNPV
jgi:hypothetical protein